MNESELPEGWATAFLPQIAELVMGQSPPSSSYNTEGHGIPFFQGKAEFGELFPVTVKYCVAPNKIAEANDILMSIRAPVGPTNLAMTKCCIGRGLAAIRPRDQVPSLYLLYFFRSIESWMSLQGTGSTFSAINKSDLTDICLPLPPLAEQRRIVAKLESLLGKVSLSQQRLSRIPNLLKRFRQSVLLAACSGKLTADWREENEDVESAAALLHRIGAERFDLWCQVAKAKARADERILRGDSWKSRYEQPITIDCETLGDLPETWKWTAFDTFVASFQYGPRFGESEYTDNGVPTVRTSDMNFRGEITLNNPPRVDVPAKSRDHFILQPDDLVVTRTGATIGKCALYDASLGPVIASAYLIRYRLTRITTVPRYLLTVLMSPWGQQQLLGGVTAVAQPNVNTTTIAQIPVPLPPLAEQQEIVRRVEKLFAFADQIEARLSLAQTSVNRLTQSILARAFRGELVPTEAELAQKEGREYEPASALLARIKSSRGQLTTAKPKRKQP